jgi:hypothetical protein
MKRLASIIAATAAAAAIAAAISLPAGAAGAGAEELSTFATCARAHGLAIPADLEGVAIKSWLGAHADDPGFEKAVAACDTSPRGPVKVFADRSPEELVTCLRDHGLDAPANAEELKPWITTQIDTAAGNAALNACGVDVHPNEKAAVGRPAEKGTAICTGVTSAAPKAVKAVKADGT